MIAVKAMRLMVLAILFCKLHLWSDQFLNVMCAVFPVCTAAQEMLLQQESQPNTSTTRDYKSVIIRIIKTSLNAGTLIKVY